VKRGFAIHTSELPEVLGTTAIPHEATFYMIRQLAACDRRTRFQFAGPRGHYISDPAVTVGPAKRA
jgi:hypothetical protein